MKRAAVLVVAAMLVGVALAIRADLHSWTWLAVTALAFFCVEVAKNAWGDVIDYDSGADLAVLPQDRTAFSGGKRVMVDELLTRGQTWAVAAIFGGTGLLRHGVLEGNRTREQDLPAMPGKTYSVRCSAGRITGRR